MDLFSSSPDGVSVVPSQEKPKLSKAQKTFNSLIGRIEKQRILLAEWELTLPRYQRRHLEELQPLLDKAAALRRELVLALDRAHGEMPLAHADRHLVADLVRDWSSELVGETGDEEMKALYNRYGGDFDKERSAALSGMKAMLEGMGLDLGDDLDTSDPLEFFQQAHARFEQEREQDEAAQRATEAARPKRKKTAKQLAKEDRLRQEEERVHQSLREIYRKLASALHPDREPDPEERTRKTELMQRVNQAYDKKDLLALLELQLQIEHIDQTSMNSFSEERLADFNKILREQLQELEMEALHRSMFNKDNLGTPVFLTPTRMLRELDADIAQTRQEVRAAEADLKAIRQLTTLKAWLKRMRRHRRQAADDFDIPF